MKFRIFLTTAFLLACVGGYYYTTTLSADPMDVIALIQRNINPKDGSVTDYAGDINFRGFDSIGYEVIDKNKVRIYFGDVQFDLKTTDLDNERLVNSLAAIGFKIEQNDGEFHVKYKGKDVKLYGRKR